ncbi:MAG: S9 family peptidase [Flavobacteriales bacterium]|nr:S9 family peptidase [Flavobacteriales bacterium]
MKQLPLFLINIFIVSTLFSQEMDESYPSAMRGDSTDIFFDKVIADPYRWLEDEQSDKTKTWITEQRSVTENYMNKIGFRDKIKQQLEEIWDFATMSTPSKYGDYSIYTKNDGKQNQSAYYMKKGKEGKEELLLDPNTLSEDGTVAVGGTSVSHDNKYFAYMTSGAGSDWKEIKVIDLKTKELVDESVKWVKFSGIAWYKNGFYYSGYGIPETGKEFSQKNEYHTVFYHQLGTPQKSDKVIYKDAENPLKNHYCSVTDDERFLVISGSKGTSGNNLIAKDLNSPKSNFVTIIDGYDYDTWVVDNFDDKLILQTNYNAPNKQIVTTTLNGSSPDSWNAFIPEKGYVLESLSIAGDKLFATYLKDVQTKIEVYDFSGKYLQDLELPGIGISNGVHGKKGQNEAYFSYTSYTTPSSSYRLDAGTLKSDLYFKPDVAFSPEDFITEQVFYKSKDGTEIPMFISYRVDLKKDGNNPTLLYGYGGFNISYKPQFDAAKFAFMMNGGIYAVANLRGGSEYGEKWHEGGMLLNKQNVFDDFIAAANYLKDNNYTSTEKLAIHGRSNGGLLVGAVMTQQPGIARVALPMVGVLDMLRYHKFTIGWAWAVEYGSSEEEKHFRNLIKYSPLHNVKPVAYPATLILTADHDDRVVPAHSFKFAAELQYKQQGKNPTLIRIDTQSGHGSGKPKSKLIEEWADIWAFTFYNMGIEIN